jgi:hypothetical protein
MLKTYLPEKPFTGFQEVFSRPHKNYSDAPEK